MADEELIISEGVTSEKIPVHYEISIYQSGLLKRLGGVYSKIMNNHYALFTYGYISVGISSFLIDIKDLDFDRKELSEKLYEYANLFGESFTKEKKELKTKAEEYSEHLKKRDLLELL